MLEPQKHEPSLCLPDKPPQTPGMTFTALLQYENPPKKPEAQPMSRENTGIGVGVAVEVNVACRHGWANGRMDVHDQTPSTLVSEEEEGRGTCLLLFLLLP
ncbi:hypothetical protein VTJ04DRAFT_327 [Mycothermus thermophilus]|uniref:uncharacterized protein n=1 Tax=Humicola insolens TaxID=85995 RepID=UPI003743F9E2